MEIAPLHIKNLAECFNNVHCEYESQDKPLININSPTLAPLKLREVLKEKSIKIYLLYM